MIQTATTMSKRPSPSPRIVAGSVLPMKATKKSSTHSGGYIGKWGRMHRAYLKERHPGRYNALLLSGKLETYLADLDEPAQARFEAIVCRMKDAEKITED